MGDEMTSSGSIGGIIGLDWSPPTHLVVTAKDGAQAGASLLYSRGEAHVKELILGDATTMVLVRRVKP